MVTHFTELNVHIKSGELAGRIFVISKRWPLAERFSLADRVRRAAKSAGAQIAESRGKRRYEARFVSKLTDADSEDHEIEHRVLTARRDGYLSESEATEMIEARREVGRMPGSMIQNPGPFLLD